MSETGSSNVGRFDPFMWQSNSLGWTNDFAVSVSRDMPNVLGFLFCSIWIMGMIAMIILSIRSRYRLEQLKNSALPLQSKAVLSLFNECKSTLSITRDIPIYSTVFLKSPITVGILQPQIYIPIHLISDFKEKDMKYILLHELQHYKCKDAIPNHIMNLAGILYWFNPAVWYAFKEIRSDREIACDSAVLQGLTEADYEAYGNTLINFAEKISLSPFPFASGLGGSISQIRKRIINIASYQPLTIKKKICGICVYGIIAAIIIGFAPFLSTYAAEHEYYPFSETNKQIFYVDLSSYFQGYKGTFVLYDSAADTWKIYNKNLATVRVAPNSTYKIYEGLIGLDYNIIEPNQTEIAWDGTNQPFAAWNKNQDLSSAMHDSVNWYFESIGASVGSEHIKEYLQQINYGNIQSSENATGNNAIKITQSILSDLGLWQ